MKFYTFYIQNILWRSIYIFFSGFFTFIIIFKNIDFFFYLELYPLLISVKEKKIIITELMQLFNIIWTFSMFLACIILFPYIIYQVTFFLYDSWYSYQLLFLINNLILLLLLFIFSYFIIHFYIISNILIFFLDWDFIIKNASWNLDLNFTLYEYIIWIITFKFSLSLVFSFSIVFLFNLMNFIKIQVIYKFISKLKKIVFFFFLFFLFLCIPPDLIIQIIVCLLIILFFELTFYFFCIKLYFFEKY